MKDYAVENQKEVDRSRLLSDKMPREDYARAHSGTVISCHDVFISYDGGILLVKRNNNPVNGDIWPIGGRIERGLSTIDSLKKKVKTECNLEISEVEFLGAARTQFASAPFEHNKGTDTLNVAFFAKGNGILKLDNNHEKPTIIKPSNYTEELREKLHPYVRDFMDLSMEKLSSQS